MSILKREVLYGTTNGISRFSDWAMCTTTLGAMAEPFTPNLRRIANSGIVDFDPTDEVNRIDKIIEVNIDKENQYLSSGPHALIGGVQYPRTGR